jgi:hypothetical protein
MEAKIEALKPRTFGALLFVFRAALRRWIFTAWKTLFP